MARRDYSEQITILKQMLTDAASGVENPFMNNMIDLALQSGATEENAEAEALLLIQNRLAFFQKLSSM